MTFVELFSEKKAALLLCKEPEPKMQKIDYREGREVYPQRGGFMGVEPTRVPGSPEGAETGKKEPAFWSIWGSISAYSVFVTE